MNRRKEIEARLAEIKQELQTRAAELTAADIEKLEAEVTALHEERAAIDAAAEKRNALLTQLAAGTVTDDNGAATSPAVVHSFRGAAGAAREQREVDKYDTVEYRTAFMNFVCRGTAMPAEYRAAETTLVEDAGAVVPTSILNEIIQKLESYGNLYAGFRKINVRGGVNIPISDLKPTAHWIADGEASDDQKLSAKNSVVFNYYGLEVKLAQSILANVVTLELFQQLFVPLATEAMVKAIEVAAINGDGEGKPLGVTKDTRVTTVVELNEEEIKTWDGWHKKVKAKIKKAYRNGAFILNQSTFDGYIDGMVDQNGQPVGRTNYGINGEETYRFMGKVCETVEDEIVASFDDAEVGDVIGVFMKLSDYVVNTNMQMTATKWTDHDNNKIKNKLLMVVDGKAADTNGIIIIKKGAVSA